jgi:hypothetical protein
MLDEAEQHGLKVDDAKKRDVLGGAPPYVAPDPNGCMHESLTGAWKLAEYVPKRHYNWTTKREERHANQFRRRTIPDGSVIHWSVYERGGNYAEHLNLPNDVTRLPKKGS